MSQAPLVGQPRGLSTLFFTEMWERFSFYGMRAFFAIFMGTSIAEGGLGYDRGKAGAVLAMYLSTGYLMSLPGGWIADKYLGQRRAVLIGGVIIMFGHILQTIPSTTVFYCGLVALVIGTGFLKPNVSTMVGQLYSKKDPRRDGGFSIFYMGINVGAFVSPIICGYLAQTEEFKAFLVEHGFQATSSWHFAFGAAAVGMFFGVIIFYLGTRSLAGVGDPPNITDPVERARNRRTLISILAALLAAPALLAGIHFSSLYDLDQERIANIFGVVLLSVFLGTFAVLYRKADARERKGVAAMFTLSIGCIAFFALFEQAAGTMNTFADERTRNVAFGSAFPSAWYQSINSVFIILLSPLFAMFFTWVAARKLPFNDIKKFGVSLLFMGLAFVFMLPVATSTDVSPLYLVLFYFMSTMGELFLSPVGLSSMSKLAPRAAGGLVMGVWFMSTANGDYIAGRVHGLTDKLALDSLFLWLAIAVFAVAAVMFAVGRYFTVKVPLESLMRGDEPKDGAGGEDDINNGKPVSDDALPRVQVVKGKKAPALASGSVSGEGIAGFATALSLWPVVLTDPGLGGVILVVLGPSALWLASRGIADARRHGVGGLGYAVATVPITLLAALYAIYKLFV